MHLFCLAADRLNFDRCSLLDEAVTRICLVQPVSFLEQAVTQCRPFIFGLYKAPLLQNRHDLFDEVAEGTRGDGIGDIEAIHARFRYPVFELICYLSRRSDRYRAKAANTDKSPLSRLQQDFP